MQRKDFYLLGILWLVVILIFYPLVYSDYLYADEAIQLWQYQVASDFTIAIRQGRWITELLFTWLFGTINTVHELNWLRLFSLVGWMICLPVWYSILKRLVYKETVYQYLPFFTCLYLVTSLSFCVSVHWAVCFELFLANTAGLVSGFLLYKSIRFSEKRMRLSSVPAIAAVITGVIALFTYQSGYCCFIIPFLVHFILPDSPKKYQVIITGMIFFLLVCVVYYPLFKLSMIITNTSGFSRTDVYINPIEKLQYFFSHPFERSWWFNIIVNENNKVAKAIYKIMLAGWAVLTFIRFGKNNYWQALKYLSGVLLLFMASYFPSLIIAENYASNRSQLALNICVWLVFMEAVFHFIKNGRIRAIGTIAVAFILIVSGWFNYRYQFLQPVREEYAAIKNYVQQQYHPGITTIYIIQPTEDIFTKKYHTHTNMDEFGVPATIFDWTVEYLPKQLVFEITGSRQAGEQLLIKHWPDRQSFTESGHMVTDSTLLIDIPAIIHP